MPSPTTAYSMRTVPVAASARENESGTLRTWEASHGTEISTNSPGARSAATSLLKTMHHAPSATWSFETTWKPRRRARALSLVVLT